VPRASAGEPVSTPSLICLLASRFPSNGLFPRQNAVAEASFASPDSAMCRGMLQAFDVPFGHERLPLPAPGSGLVSGTEGWPGNGLHVIGEKAQARKHPFRRSMNDGSHTIKDLLSTAQTSNSFDDLTTRGGGADTFDYAPLFGTVITNFNSAQSDTITLPPSEFANFAYVQAHSTVAGGNTVIVGSNGNSIALQGITTLQE